MIQLKRVLSLLAVTAGCGLLVAPASANQAADAVPLDTTAQFDVVVAGGSAKVGEVATVTVTITAGAGFKPNAQYPHKVKNLSGSGVDLPSGEVTGAIGGTTIVFSVPVTPTSAGAHAVSGKARFSVCNDTECILKSTEVNATVTGT